MSGEGEKEVGQHNTIRGSKRHKGVGQRSGREIREREKEVRQHTGVKSCKGESEGGEHIEDKVEGRQSKQVYYRHTLK